MRGACAPWPLSGLLALPREAFAKKMQVRKCGAARRQLAAAGPLWPPWFALRGPAFSGLDKMGFAEVIAGQKEALSRGTSPENGCCRGHFGAKVALSRGTSGENGCCKGHSGVKVALSRGTSG